MLDVCDRFMCMQPLLAVSEISSPADVYSVNAVIWLLIYALFGSYYVLQVSDMLH